MLGTKEYCNELYPILSLMSSPSSPASEQSINKIQKLSGPSDCLFLLTYYALDLNLSWNSFQISIWFQWDLKLDHSHVDKNFFLFLFCFVLFGGHTQWLSWDTSGSAFRNCPYWDGEAKELEGLSLPKSGGKRIVKKSLSYWNVYNLCMCEFVLVCEVGESGEKGKWWLHC